MKIAVPASTTLSLYLRNFDVPDSDSSCKNVRLQIKDGGRSELNLCNGNAKPGMFVSIPTNAAAYTLEINFQGAASQSTGTGFVLILSTCEYFIFYLLIKLSCKL